MNKSTLMIIVSMLICLGSILYAVWYYASRQGVTLRESFQVLWREGLISGFADLRAAFIPTVKSLLRLWWDLLQRAVAFFVAILRPEPAKHTFTPDLEAAILAAVSGYIYAPFQPVIDVRYTPAPSYIYVSLYTKAAVTEEVKTEITWAVQAAFREYLAAYGFDWPHTVVPYTQDNYIRVCIYYAENSAELPAYQEQVHRSMLMMADPAFRPLAEADVPDTTELVLGYDLEKWQTTGQVVPIAWDVAAAPHMMVSGPTGGGKSVYVKVMLEQLLKAGADVAVCDFKGQGDYKAIRNYFAGADCDLALARYCDGFEKAREYGGDGRHHVLVFDEFGSFAASKEKKEYEALMKMMAGLIFMGRSYGYSVILVSQRFDADTIRTAFREQFGVKVYMGPSISPQAAGMLFPGADIDKGQHLPPCCGYLSTPRVDLVTVITPMIDTSALDLRLKALGEQGT